MVSKAVTALGAISSIAATIGTVFALRSQKRDKFPIEIEPEIRQTDDGTFLFTAKFKNNAGVEQSFTGFMQLKDPKGRVAVDPFDSAKQITIPANGEFTEDFGLFELNQSGKWKAQFFAWESLQNAVPVAQDISIKFKI